MARAQAYIPCVQTEIVIKSLHVNKGMLQLFIDSVSIVFRSKANFQLIEYLRTDHWWCNRPCSYNYTSTRMFMMKPILWIVQSIYFLEYKFHIVPECSCVLHQIHCNSSAKIKLTNGTIGKNANHRLLGRRCSAVLLYILIPAVLFW